MHRLARSCSGQMASVGFIGALVVAVGVLCITVDVSHGLLVQHQLKSASEAAALAGASELTLAPGMSQEALKRAGLNAEHILASHSPDRVPITTEDENTTIDVLVDGKRMPRSIEVRVERNVPLVFGRFFGIQNYPVVVSSVAQASLGLLAVAPGQLTNLAVSIDTSPTEGPAAKEKVNAYKAATGITLVVGGNKKEEKNASWIGDWKGADSPLVSFSNPLKSPDSEQSSYADIQEGHTIIIPIIQGDPPFLDGTMVGFTGFLVEKKNPPNRLRGKFCKVVLVGKPGLDTDRANKRDKEANSTFLYSAAPWKVMLVR